MKSLREQINETLIEEAKRTSKKTKFKPKTRGELKTLVDRLIKERGNNADLNDIDTSLVEEMWDLFSRSEFNGDISEWNVSNVKDMRGMFFHNFKFNGDISKWDVSKVKNMSCMFMATCFNGDISKWDVSNVEKMNAMFQGSQFNGDISKWDVSNVEIFRYMFYDSAFNRYIADWNVQKDADIYRMFDKSPLENDAYQWYK